MQPRVSDGDKGVNVIPLEEQRGTSRQVASVATATSEDEMVSVLTRAHPLYDQTLPPSNTNTK